MGAPHLLCTTYWWINSFTTAIYGMSAAPESETTNSQERKCHHMKQHRPFWRILFFCFALVLAVPVISMLQTPLQAEAAAPKLSKKKATVKEGKTLTLTVKNPTQKVTWKSSNSKVVKITKKTGSNKSKATLKGLKKGTATITAKVGKKKLTAKITVKHVHKWRGYATCTEPDLCTTCGAGRGVPAHPRPRP